MESIHAEVKARFEFGWKGLARMRKDLAPSWGEELVAPIAGPPARAGSIADKSMVVPAANAREKFDKLYKAEAPKTGELIAALAKKNYHKLRSMGEGWIVENTIIMYACGEGSEARLCKIMADMFPTQDKEVAVEQVLLKINNMVGTDAFKLAAKPAQAKHRVVVKMLGYLVDSRPPPLQDLQGRRDHDHDLGAPPLLRSGVDQNG